MDSILSRRQTCIGMLLLAWMTGCGPSQPAPDLFSVPITYPVGKKPAMVVASDMSNDGYADILVANSASNSLSYLEGMGDGTFKQAVTLQTGREPVALETADFNGDGLPDIAIANYGDGNISIILGQKDGLFKLKGHVKVSRLPIAVAAGDFNNDEKMDLAVTLRFDKLVIMLGVGDGTFKVAEAYKAPGTPAYMAVGDYNGDNNEDIAIAFNAVEVKFIRVFYGNGDGTFDSPQRLSGGGQSSFITHYDMNSDGKPDLISSSPMKDSLHLHLGDGKGSFRTVADFAAEKSPNSIVAGEFTGDNIPDLIVCNRRDGSISLLQGNGDGSFVFPHFNYPVGRNPRALTGADFNNDGLMDLALVLYDSQVLEIIMGKTSVPTSIES